MSFITNKLINYHKYQHLLDGYWTPKFSDICSVDDYKYNYGKEIVNFNVNKFDISKEIYKFLVDNSIKKLVLSLSGGVDSMVILTILINIKISYPDIDLDIYIVMINYNLRPESLQESEFIFEFCKYYNLYCEIINVEKNSENIGNRKFINEKRSDFEEKTLNIRLDGYKNLIDKFKCDGVVLGHHKDDIIENIFTNTMKGHNILDIEVMKKIGYRKGIKMFRPLLDFEKSIIYSFANINKIPYFLDTTPKWSRRGKMRNEIFPLFSSVFGNGWNKKVKEIGNQSNNWKKTIDNLIIDPWLKDICFFEFGFIIPIRYEDDENLWLYFMPKLFFKINYSSIRKKSIKLIFNNLKNKSIRNKILDSGFEFSVTENHVIVFDNNKYKFKESDFILENSKLKLKIKNF